MRGSQMNKFNQIFKLGKLSHAERVYCSKNIHPESWGCLILLVCESKVTLMEN